MVASIGNRFEKIGAWPRQNCTTHRLALGDRFRKEAYKDVACKGIRRADAAKETSTKVGATQGVGVGIAHGLQGWHGKIFGETPQEAGWDADKLCETSGERAKAGVAEFETYFGHTQGGRQEEAFCFFQAQGGEVFTRGNADDAVKYTTEVIWAENGDIRHIFEREWFTHLFSHDTNDAFNGQLVRHGGAYLAMINT